MNINWKLRLKNKATLTAIVTAVVGCAYTILAALGVTPAIDQPAALSVVAVVVTLLVSLGVVTDPTTAGVSDSAQAMAYEEPRDDTATTVSTAVTADTTTATDKEA